MTARIDDWRVEGDHVVVEWTTSDGRRMAAVAEAEIAEEIGEAFRAAAERAKERIAVRRAQSWRAEQNGDEPPPKIGEE